MFPTVIAPRTLGAPGAFDGCWWGTLVALSVLLVVAFFLLLRAFQPVGEVASGGRGGRAHMGPVRLRWGNGLDHSWGLRSRSRWGPDGPIWVTDAGVSTPSCRFKPDGTSTRYSTGLAGKGALSVPELGGGR